MERIGKLFMFNKIILSALTQVNITGKHDCQTAIYI